MINEGNKEDQYLEKKGESTKDSAMRKASSRRHRFDTETTHKNAERETITWARPGTRSHADSLDRQRKSAHRSERGRTKPQAGASSEQRRNDDIWYNRFPEDRPLKKYEKIQKQKKEGKPTSIDIKAQKQGLIRKGERRRELRTQAVNAIRRAVGGGYVSEAKVDDRLSADQKEIIRNRRLSPGDRLPVRGETSRDTEERLTQKRRDRNKGDRGGQTVRGSQLPKYKKHAEFGGITYQKDWNPEKVSARRDELRAKRTRNNIRSFKESKTFEEFMIEASKGKSPRPTVLPKSRERDIGIHDDWKDKPLEWGERPEAGNKLRRRAQAVVGTRRREDKETGVYESSGMTPENEQTWKRLVAQYGKQPFKNPRKSRTKSASQRENPASSSTSSKPRRRGIQNVEYKEDFVPLTPEKEKRVQKRVGELARDVQLHGARMKELQRKPFGKFRPGVKQEKQAVVKSSRKKVKQVRSASDALIHASVSREANTQKKINDLKQRLKDLGEES